MAKDAKSKIIPAREMMEDGTLDQPPVDYNDEERQYYSHLTTRLTSAVDQRNQNYVEFDDRTYRELYEANQKAANSYNPPKTNSEDTRIVTGTTNEKEVSLLSALLNLNIESEINAFDKRQIKIQELGKNVQDLVYKSRKVEKYDLLRPLVFKELLDQGTCYVEETTLEEYEVTKKMQDGWEAKMGQISKIKWSRDVVKKLPLCKSVLVPGINVYLGNFKEFFLDNQPYLFTYDKISYESAKMIFGDWERFKNVPFRFKEFKETDEKTGDISNYWHLEEFSDGYVEVVRYQDPINNEYQVLLNGVMMLPVGFPLSAVSPSGGFTLSKGDTEPISKFISISKSIPAKTSVDQGVADMMLRMILLAMKKGILPPMANSSNRILSRKVLLPGQITKGIKAGDLEELGTNNGVTSSMINGFEMLMKIIDGKSVQPTFTGSATKGEQTATEIETLQQQSMAKLGLIIYGVINLEIQMIEKRIANGLENWTKPIGEKVDDVKNEITKIYQSFSMDTTDADGQDVLKILEFNPEKSDLSKSDKVKEIARRKGESPSMVVSKEVRAEEKRLSRIFGREVRKVYLHPEKFRALQNVWEVDAQATPKNNSNLEKVMFSQKVREYMELFGGNPAQNPHVKERWGSVNQEDSSKWFPKQEAPAGGAPVPPAGGAPVPPAPGAGGAPNGGQNPLQASVQAMQGQATNPALKRLMS
jgi:hypothetical protein